MGGREVLTDNGMDDPVVSQTYRNGVVTGTDKK
jgi:hypothetical protein